MYEIFMSNFVTIFLICGFIVILLTGNIFDKKVERLFTIGVGCVAALVFVDIMDSHFSQQSTLNELRYLSSALGYTIRPIALGIFISIMLRKDKPHIILWLPIVIEAVIAMTNQYTHIMFYFDENNVFHRGPLGFLPHILCIAYMFLLVFVALRMYKVTDMGEMFTIVYIIAICFVSMFFETFYGMKYLLTGAIISACTIYYTYLYVQVYKIDTLTGLLDRRSYEREIEKLKNNPLVFINIDLNGLKDINDTFGHTEGDKALCSLGTVLLHTSRNKYRVYRLGGDEFLVLGIRKTLEEADEFMAKAKEELSKTKYAAAFGSAMYLPGDNIEEIYAKADEAMYKEKKKLKEDSKLR